MSQIFLYLEANLSLPLLCLLVVGIVSLVESEARFLKCILILLYVCTMTIKKSNLYGKCYGLVL